MKRDISAFTAEHLPEWQAMIGQRVWKNTRASSKEPNPFKSGLKVNTVKAIVPHDYTEHLAFTFVEDDSKVECFRCALAPKGLQC